VIASRPWGVVAALVLLSARPLVAQMDMHGHGGAPPARLGRVSFPSSCRPAAAADVERGVALLHSFWYEEAGRVFRDAASADSTCAMAYWGRATSLLHPLWAPTSPADLRAGAALSQHARALDPPTARERGYVDAIAAFYGADSGARFVDRLRAWSDGLDRLRAAEPADTEARIFFALSLIAVAQSSPPDTTFALQRRAGDLLEPLFQLRPEHPGLAHYLIHAYDAPALADRAVRAADRYAAIAPAVPHARHMPSHIYTRLGMWDASIAANAGAASAARQYEIAQHLDAVWDQRLHSMDYMVYAYLQRGRTAPAARLVREAAGMERVMPPHATAAEYALTAIPARYALERGRWAEAAALPLRPDLAEPGAIAVTYFARALGAARAGDTATARTALTALATVDDTLAARAVPIWAGTVHAQRLAASAWLALAERDTAAALRLASGAADLEDLTPKHPVTPGAILPARELLGDLLLTTGRPADALAAYQASLGRAPRRARSLQGAALAAERAGDRAAAERWHAQYRALGARVDRGPRRPTPAS
jgi:hypothetical protein